MWYIYATIFERVYTIKTNISINFTHGFTHNSLKSVDLLTFGACFPRMRSQLGTISPWNYSHFVLIRWFAHNRNLFPWKNSHLGIVFPWIYSQFDIFPWEAKVLFLEGIRVLSHLERMQGPRPSAEPDPPRGLHADGIRRNKGRAAPGHLKVLHRLRMQR